MKKTLEDFDFYGKKVLVRVDFNVPVSSGKILNDTRIVESLKTIKYLLASSAKLILVSHLGRPDGKEQKEFSLKPVCEHLKTLLPRTNIRFAETFDFDALRRMTDSMQNGEILMLENIRFLPEEELNDETLSKNLASLADVFVMDAFGTAHRKHASTYGVAKLLPSCMGKLVEREIKIFDQTLNNPARPLVAILGGAKISDKLLMTENLLKKVDIMLIGGGMCFSFLKALKADVGNSLMDNSKIDFCYNIIKQAINCGVKIVLPVDFVCAKNMDSQDTIILTDSELGGDIMGLDIGQKTIDLFSKYIKTAKTIIWNGPMGAYEYEKFSNGTKQIAKAICQNKKARAIVGGGDVVSAIKQNHLETAFYHISTGGGASLKLLEGQFLYAVDVLQSQEK